MNKHLLLYITAITITCPALCRAEAGYIFGVRSIVLTGIHFSNKQHHVKIIATTNQLRKEENIIIPEYSKYVLSWLPYFPLNDNFHFIIEEKDKTLLDIHFDKHKNYQAKTGGPCSPLPDMSNIYPYVPLDSYVPIKLTTLACNTPIGRMEIQFFCNPLEAC